MKKETIESIAFGQERRIKKIISKQLKSQQAEFKKKIESRRNIDPMSSETFKALSDILKEIE